jgi:hypothetical protein
MNRTLSFEDIFCSEYERLLEVCQRALTVWDQRCEIIRKTNLFGEDTDRELLRLQVSFATAFAVLQRHAHLCERCKHYPCGSEDFPETVALGSSTLPN